MLTLDKEDCLQLINLINYETSNRTFLANNIKFSSLKNLT